MFSNLSDKLISIIKKIGRRGILTEEIVKSTMEEIRITLLDADVALPVVKNFSAKLKEKLVGQKVLNSITPEQTVLKAVYDELVELLGASEDDSNFRRGKILMLGLQGTGKTTTSAKLASLFKNKFNRKVLLVSLDTYRPAAIKQLKVLAQNNSIDFFDDFLSGDTPIDIARKSLSIQDKYDITIYDTAGRVHIDERMMDEVISLKKLIQPKESLLVVDGMMGQDAVNMAKSFNDATKLTGLIFTRMDGDSKGGAVISAKYVVNCQIKYICTGEKISDIEDFNPKRIASRILDQGDMRGLIEKTQSLDHASLQKTLDNKFHLESMEAYLVQLTKIGGLHGLMKLMPGMGKLKAQLDQPAFSEKIPFRQLAIIRAMTKEERRNPQILNASRRRRIARGCAQEVMDVNRLIKDFEMLKRVMSKKFAGKKVSLTDVFRR